MKTITIVTGNKGKLAEWQRLFPTDFKLEAADIDLDEIQSLDLEAIVIDKAQRAFDRLGKPVVVEDISAGLEKLNGLPGPFIKFFEIALGLDVLYTLAEKEGDMAIVTCVVCYFDGMNIITARGDIKGKVIPSRGNQGFGFDKVFVPEGSTKTFGEMDGVEKDKTSHRARAINSLVEQLRKLD
jgi:inosine triphosphate pyrophosphatase